MIVTNGRFCETCNVRLIPWSRWCLLTPEERDYARQVGFNRAGGAYICHSCGCRQRRHEQPHTRLTYTRQEIVAEWRHFADPSVSIAENCRRIAPRMGLQWRSLERAVNRAQKAGELRARSAA